MGFGTFGIIKGTGRDKFCLILLLHARMVQFSYIGLADPCCLFDFPFQDVPGIKSDLPDL